jgi:uncharacterized membrane protein YgcG
VEVGAPRVTDGEAAEAGQPGQRSLDDPAVAAEPFAALDAAPSDPGRDAAGSALAPATAMIVSFVGVQLVGPAPWATTTAGAHAWHRIERGGQHAAVVAVGPRERQAERRAPGVHDEVTLRARLAPVRQVRARRGAPFFVDKLALSTAARDQSSASASCSCSSITRWSAAQTPAACHVPSRRQLVLPLQPTSERGRCFHCMPVRRTKMMPASAARSEARGHPPFGFSGSGGRSGSTTAHRSSGTRASTPLQPAHTGFVPRSKVNPLAAPA